mgnify:CR=1 FL=1
MGICNMNHIFGCRINIIETQNTVLLNHHSVARFWIHHTGQNRSLLVRRRFFQHLDFCSIVIYKRPQITSIDSYAVSTEMVAEEKTILRIILQA